MKLSKLIVGSAVTVGLLIGGPVGPAAAHSRAITQVHTNTDHNNILVSAWVEPEGHPGVMKIALKKRNASGDWVLVARQRATYQLGWGYTTNFDPVAGRKRCKAVARLTSDNHPAITKASPVFAC